MTPIFLFRPGILSHRFILVFPFEFFLEGGVVNPFRTTVSGESTQLSGSSSPRRDYGSKGIYLPLHYV